jgi:YHS domain-containing protein
MNLIARIVRFLFWLLIISWSVALLRRVVGWMLRDSNARAPQNQSKGEDSNTPGTNRRLVRDPVCGMHVAEELAIPLREGSEVLHFCSVECREKYAGSERQIAANG